MDTKNLNPKSENTARAYANIGLIKYWGKKDETLVLPYNSSISLTLDAFYTETTILIDSALSQDVFYLNDVMQDEAETVKVSKIIDLFRAQTNQLNQYVKIISFNNMPTAAGVSSSSSGLAALVIACNKAFATNFDCATLSRYARYGSGSACRSLFPGLVKWDATDEDLTSIASPLKSNLDLSMLIILISVAKKDMLSRAGMKLCVDTSCFYPAWISEAKQDFNAMLTAIAENDFLKIGEISERNALKMHATTLGASPPFSYLNAESLNAIKLTKEIRQQYPCFFTMDAGPNVKILCETKNAEFIKQELLKHYCPEQIIVSGTCKQVDL